MLLLEEFLITESTTGPEQQEPLKEHTTPITHPEPPLIMAASPHDAVISLRQHF